MGQLMRRRKRVQLVRACIELEQGGVDAAEQVADVVDDVAHREEAHDYVDGRQILLRRDVAEAHHRQSVNVESAQKQMYCTTRTVEKPQSP